MSENELQKIRNLQIQVQRWFWLSCPWGIGVLVEMVRTVPNMVSSIIDGNTGPFPEIIPFALLFTAWWIQYETAEFKLIKMERRNFEYAKNHDGTLAVKYGIPEKFIGVFNLMHIKLRQPIDLVK